MKIGYPPGLSFKPLTGSGFRLGLTLIITFMVVSSPILIFLNPVLISAKSNNIDTSSQHSGFSLKDTSTPITSPTNVSPLDSDFTTQAALSSLTARPTNNIVNTNSFYDIVFLAATSGAIKTIEVTFPAGTAIPIGAFFNEAEKCVPGSDCTEMTGTVSKSGQTITYTITNAVNVPAGTKIRLEFANINNPLQVSSNYKVTVTTRDAANAIIDGPSESTAYTIKQIGVNAIAEGAIKPTITAREGESGSIPAGTTRQASAFCLEGETVTGGGYGVSSPGGEPFLHPFAELPGTFTNPIEWKVLMYNSHPTDSFSFFARAQCLAPMP